ncbi:ataxin-7-like protein 2b isoform X2 [Conger conger]|uniref:ataxin-7-like protein 2b isoform X2 n=1 Tax=Conger conger TaxID=82655 RepID=UPI002A5A05FC|nr:ataxin-7-like protein 2b isoform X2 [Conger conger]
MAYFAGCEVEECSKNGKRKVETMTLRKEDMSIFGHCPAHDEFCLVVCGHCGQVVKPQAFERHCEARHGPLGKLCGRLHPSPSAGAQKPRPGHAPPRPGHAPPRPARDSRPQGTGPPRVPPQPPLPLGQHRPARPLKEGAGCSPTEELSQTPPPPDSPPYSMSPGNRGPQRPPHRTGPSPSEKPLPRRGELGRPPDSSSTLRAPRTYSKTYKKVPKKECNLDKHCGVLDLERRKLCTRLLTCNIHSIHQRRQVAGRSRNFDQLVAELKMSSRARERAGQVREGAEVGSPSPEPPGGQTGSPACRRRLANCTVPRSRTPSGSGAEEGEHWEEEPPHPSAPSRLSSEESEGEGQEEPPDVPFTSWHPKPLALCSFGSHALGRSVFTFDRRLHHLRSALNTMVEHHLSAHLWKKIPQAADLQSTLPSLTSPHYNSQHSTGGTTRGAGLPGAASSLRTCASSSSSSSSLGVGRGGRPSNSSPSPGSACRVSEGKGGGQPITAPLQTTAPSPSPSGEARPRNPVGRPSKQQTRLREAERRSPPTPSKRRKPPPEDHSTSPSPSPSPSRDRNCSGHERGRPPGFSRTTPSPHGPINGALSPGSKPPRPKPPSPEPRLPSPGLSKWPLPHGHAQAPPPGHAQSPPPDPSSRGRGGGPGPHRKAVSYDHKGLGKKRKSSCPPPLAPPRPSKLPRLSAASHSGFFSWKKDGKAGGVPAGLGKGLGTQKPKLHH